MARVWFERAMRQGNQDAVADSLSATIAIERKLQRHKFVKVAEVRQGPMPHTRKLQTFKVQRCNADEFKLVRV